MKRTYLLTASCLLINDLLVNSTFAADLPSANRSAIVASKYPNAAVIYWQAFSAMPTLNDDQKQKFEAVTKAPAAQVSDDLLPIAALFETSLRELHRAGSMAPCDWLLDSDAGPNLLMTHLQKARDLSRAALLRARLRFSTGETDAAVADVIAVLKLARNCGTSPILISLLVDYAIEKSAIEVLVANLARLKPEQLDQLTLSLKHLPPTATFADCVRWESNSLGGWFESRIESVTEKLSDPKAGGKVISAIQKELGGEDEVKPKADDLEGLRRHEMIQSMTVADLRESLRRMRSDYEAMAKIASLSSTEQAGRWAEFEAELTDARRFAKREDLLRYLSVSFLPSVAKTYEREEQLQVRRYLLDLAVQVQRHGPNVLKSVEPFGGGKVEHRKHETGFELRYQYPTSDKMEALSVGVGK